MSASPPTMAILVVTSVTVMDATTNNDGITALSSVPLPPPPPPISRASARRVWWALPLLTVAWLLMLVIIVGSLTRVRLWELAPGAAEAVAPRMSFGDDALAFATRYETAGEVMFVTALGSRLSLLDVIAAWRDDDVRILTFEERFGTQTPAQQREGNARAMVSSKQIAEFVAFTRLGIESEFVYGDVVIDEVVCENMPDPLSACEQLAPGDTIVSFDGQPTPILPALIELVVTKSPGDVVRVGVRREGSDEVVTLNIKLIAAPDDSQRTIVGIMPRDTRTVKTPFEVGIDTDSIGGPSAGLAFTLALIDELSQGSLTGNLKVAVTGTIDGDESVGAVGAIPQKAVAARDSGAKVFLVPASQSAEDIALARRIGGSQMRVETVGTLQDALDVLRGIGGDPLTDSTNLD
ncbi:MAG: hypothetical protein RL643_884 [Actinomycetota bacterium]